MLPHSTAVIASVIAIALAIAGPAPSLAFETYQVTNVQSDDALIMREEPSGEGKPSDSKELGRIPGGSDNVLGTGRSLLVGSQTWREVSHGGTRGWVNDKYLTATDQADLKDATFSCSGTEPFWGVKLGPAKGSYSDPDTADPESPTQLETKSVQAATARLFPLLYRLADTAGKPYIATVSHRNSCTDGMSEYDYAFEVFLIKDDVFQQGCCVIER